MDDTTLQEFAMPAECAQHGQQSNESTTSSVEHRAGWRCRNVYFLSCPGGVPTTDMIPMKEDTSEGQVPS
ncbi:hypothetical protein Y1Q_0017192 [Alligator mississippiensis]|uniref:Uncharacterized protein n=1 Tax=Alligator mississippiensis TaxID=8496 RepID=A0A151MPS4_ALLMI|nr:hypothetical protein Y1Q_0017192 [Alligator mississippiensis]